MIKQIKHTYNSVHALWNSADFNNRNVQTDRQLKNEYSEDGLHPSDGDVKV